MKEDKNVKEKYNKERENEEEINETIGKIMQNFSNTKDLIDFTQKIRDYRTRIYELKMQLKEEIKEAYKIKEVSNFKCLNTVRREYACRKYENAIGYLKTEIMENREVCYEEKGKSNIEKIIEKVNIINMGLVFQYYEREIAFWQEMNLKRIMEIDDKEHYLE